MPTVDNHSVDISYSVVLFRLRVFKIYFIWGSYMLHHLLAHLLEEGRKKLKERGVDLFGSSSLEEFHSLLSEHQQSSPIANKSLTAARSNRNSKALPNQHTWAEVAKVSQNPLVLWHVSLYKVKMNQDQWRNVALFSIIMQDPPLTVCGVLLILFLTTTCPLKCLFSAKYHTPSHKTALRKTSCDETELLEKPDTFTSVLSLEDRLCT